MNAEQSRRIYKNAEHMVSWSVFAILLLTYWLTVPPTVSYWDCPEYVSAAWLLEIGHPPGNPVWMLVERVVTMLAPAGRYAALAVNMSSGLFTALTGWLLAKSVYVISIWILGMRQRRRRAHAWLSAGAAAVAALSFGWCDSAWYSAVEAEVYAMSIFLTALCLWLMLKWAVCRDRRRAWRYLVLIAYLCGLSIGVHQLNLLCIPAMALIWAYRRGFHHARSVWVIVGLSVIAVGLVLVGMMPSTIALAARFELFAVNIMGWPALSGVAIYIVALALSLLLALSVTQVSGNRALILISICPAIFLSGIFILDEHFLLGAALTVVGASLLVKGKKFKRRRLNLSLWMLAMILTGYSAYAIIPIRGWIPSPANPTMPGEPFSFAAYQAREQYGGAPLLYGQTPYSRAMIQERFLPGDSRPDYSRRYLKRDHPLYAPLERGALLNDPYGFLTADDSAFNRAAIDAPGDRYIKRGYRVNPVYTPELNMWFPRITSTDPSMLRIYESWVGMNADNMVSVEVSDAVDADGNYVSFLNSRGERVPRKSLRPTYMQNLAMLGSYQIGYMYLRYLMWNFSGRQNDMHSTGEVEHGNFITGFSAIDNAMLGAEESLPAEAGSDNPGRNVYYMLPFLLGLFGAVWLLFGHKPGRHTDAVVALLFVMTGLAIVVYLNQSPGEARERDYSFLGSFYAFAVWIGMGALGITVSLWRMLCRFADRLRLARDRKVLRVGERRRVAIVLSLLPLAVPLLMFAQNLDDHNRRGRRAASNIAANYLNSLQENAILFVNGDNFTFPLWYAAEVEDIRTDVAVINTSYLTLPAYAAARLGGWRNSAPLQTTLKRSDIIYNGYAFVRYPGPDAPRLCRDAVEALAELRDSRSNRLNATHLRIADASGDSIVIPVAALARNIGGTSLDFRLLLMLDIVATNALSDSPRPIYWHAALPRRSYAGLEPYTRPELMSFRLYGGPSRHTDSITVARAELLRAPNDMSRNVYMDAVPARQIETQRMYLIHASRRLFERGDTAAALSLAHQADTLMGPLNYAYSAIGHRDSVFYTATELGRLLQHMGLVTANEEMVHRGEEFVMADSMRRVAWQDYRRALPPLLRGKMSIVAR